jgi:hypothetical protein
MFCNSCHFCSSFKPLIDIISQFLDKSNWFYVAPCLTLSEQFVKTLPSRCRGLLPEVMPLDAKMLLMSRIQGGLFCLASGQKVDDVRTFCFSTFSLVCGASYSTYFVKNG